MEAMETDQWLALCRRVVARQAKLFDAQREIGERSVYEGRGEGGDMALALDRRCEEIVLDELERAVGDRGPSLLAVSEERGEVAIGDGEAALRVVIDPIDGSLNARRTIPSHSLSLAVAGGETMDTVSFGFVHDFGAREEFAAARGSGAILNGRPLEQEPPDVGLEVVGVESAEPGWIAPPISRLIGRTYRLRVVGSIAISVSYVAAGRFDAMFSARPCRSVDAAAAQLLVREAGGVVSFGDLDLGAADLGLEARYTIAAARRAEHLETVIEAQAAGPAVEL